jgi:hypothetical protein
VVKPFLIPLRPAKLVASDLFASSDEVFEEGEYVNFNVKVTNIGETEGSYTMRAQARKSPEEYYQSFFETKLRRSQLGDDN